LGALSVSPRYRPLKGRSTQLTSPIPHTEAVVVSSCLSSLFFLHLRAAVRIAQQQQQERSTCTKRRSLRGLQHSSSRLGSEPPFRTSQPASQPDPCVLHPLLVSRVSVFVRSWRMGCHCLLLMCHPIYHPPRFTTLLVIAIPTLAEPLSMRFRCFVRSFHLQQ